MHEASADRATVPHLESPITRDAVAQRRRSAGTFELGRARQLVPGRERTDAELGRRRRRPRARSSRAMSTSSDGRAIRSFSTGSERLAAGEHASPRARRAAASASLDASWRARTGRGGDHGGASRTQSGAAARTEPHDRSRSQCSGRGCPRSASPDRVVVRVAVAREEVDGGQDHPGRAEPALEAVLLDERPLDRMELAVGREPLDRRHLGARGLEREHRAALHRPPVEEHRARAALARVAADVRAGQPEAVTERVDEERPRLDVERARLAVDAELETSEGVRHSQEARRPSREGTRGMAAGRCAARP